MSLIARIDERIAARSLLDHPFYRRWLEGTLPTENLQEYARQYYAFESSFPRFLSALHSRTNEPWARQSILENLWDEEHGDENHGELWLRFAEGVGVAREDVAAAEPNEATRSLLDTYRQATSEASVPAGVAAVYAYERQVPEVAAAKITGLRERYELNDPRTLAFFRVHSVLDEEHAGAEARIVEELATDEDEVLDTADAALEAWWGFLDAVCP